MMKMTVRLMAAAALCALPVAADAAVTLDIAQVGADVVVNASGTFDTGAAISYGPPQPITKGVLGTYGYLAIGGNALANSYIAVPPVAMTMAALGAQSSGLGPTIGFSTDFTTFFLDAGYISNSLIASTGTFDNVTISSLGLISGSYNFAVGNNAVTLNIGPSLSSAVPEPATWALMILGFGLTGMAVRRRRRPAPTAALA